MADDYAARARAAHYFAGLSKDELAQRLGVSVRQLGRYESGQQGIAKELRERIADACQVPRWFMEHGWAGASEVLEPDRFADLERRMADLESLVTERLERELEEGLRAAREELGLAPQPVADRRRTGRRKNGSE